MIAQAAKIEVQHEYDPRGGAYELFSCTEPAVLLDGPAGTGKTRSCGEYIYNLAKRWPKCRIAVIRKTRESLTDSFMPMFEDEVLTPDDSALRGPGRMNRHQYEFANGSTIGLFGMDKPMKLYSSQFDCIYCFPGNTKVESQSRLVRAYRRRTFGPFITIKTSRGNELTGTPNHPILTDHGWVALGKLKRGDYVICGTARQNMLPVRPDVQQRPPTIAEVFCSLQNSSVAASKRIIGSVMDFHGDGRDADVDVVSAGSLLKNSVNSSFRQPFIQHDRQRRGVAQSSLLGLRTIAQPRFRRDDAFEYFGGHLRSEPLLSRSLGSFDLGLTGTSDVVSTLSNFAPKRPWADSKLGGNGLGPEACDVSPDRIVHVSRVDRLANETHVFNLQTQDNWYFANNIVAHNCQEAVELTEDQWERLYRGLRNRRIPHPGGEFPTGFTHDGHYYPDIAVKKLNAMYPGLAFEDGTPLFLNQIIADTNPDAPGHWLNQKCNKGHIYRIFSRHGDNPAVSRDYLKKLSGLTGTRRDRLFLGRWVAAEGQIFDLDPATHVIQGTLEQDKCQMWRIVPASAPDKPIYMTWFVAGVDWGWTAPGVIGVWGIDEKNRAYLVKEVYEVGKTYEWWAIRAEELRRRFNIKRFICDPAEPMAISMFNERMGRVGGHWIATEAENDLMPGINVVNERLRKNKLFVLAGCTETHASDDDKAGRAWGLIDEVPRYVWREQKADEHIHEEPKKGVADHSCDQTRYVCVFLDGNDWRPKASEVVDRPGTFGDVLKMGEFFKEIESGKWRR